MNAAVLKTVKDASPSGVRIPDSPLKKKKSPITVKYAVFGLFYFMSEDINLGIEDEKLTEMIPNSDRNAKF